MEELSRSVRMDDRVGRRGFDGVASRNMRFVGVRSQDGLTRYGLTRWKSITANVRRP
jgi:hypothetical protein